MQPEVQEVLQQRQVKLNNFLFVSTAESAALFYSSQNGRYRYWNSVKENS